MQFEFSATFARFGSSARNFQEIWTRMCHDLLAAVFPSNSIVRMNPDEYGVDLLDQTTGTAYCCHVVDEPSSDTLSADGAIASLERAVRHRDHLGWNKYNIATNTVYSDEGMAVLEERISALQIASEKVGFLGPVTWNRLCSEYPRVVEDWFEYRVQVSKDVVKKAFADARYLPKYVDKYAAQIDEADFNIVLTNNRTPLELVLPFAPQLTVEHLLDVGKVLLDLSLDATDFRDLGTSSRLSLSVVIDGVTQGFSTLLADVPVHSGGKAQIWIKIIWEEKSFDQSRPDDGLPFRATFLVCRFAARECGEDAILATAPHIRTKTASLEEQTLARKVTVVSAHIWQKVKRLLPAEWTASQSSDFGRSKPVRLGASAPKAVAASSSFVARFVAYHPDLEADLTKQLNHSDPEATHRLDSARANWKLGTRVRVRVYGHELVVDPVEDEFRWAGEKQILDFRVTVGKEATGSRDLKFDVYVDDLRICRIWMPMDVSNKPTDELQHRTKTSPRTAFASYASQDRLRVLDRVASMEINSGLQIFLDCVSMRPNARYCELLPEMVRDTDQLLLFWSTAARDSSWVEKEWRTAFEHKGIDGIEIHPLSTYDEAQLPSELAALAHGGDPKMVIRAHEERVRSTKTQNH